VRKPLRSKCKASSLPRSLIRDSFGWDTPTWSRSLDFWDQHTSIALPMRALEVGATGNNGGLSLYLASRGCKVTWSSLEEPEPYAKQLHLRYGIEKQISYETINVLAVPYDNDFDLIVFKSLLGGFGMVEGDTRQAQAAALIQMRKALKPGGELWWVENAAGSAIHSLLRSRYGAGKRGWQYLPVDEVPLTFSGFDRVEYATFGVCSVFGRTEWQRRILAPIDQYVLEPITPSSWHYVVAGVARKALRISAGLVPFMLLISAVG
jgi:hypothetical protein